MTPKTIRLFLENLIDDTPDIDFEYQLLTQAKNHVESMYKPLILQNVDTTKTSNAGDTYLSTKALPIDFRRMISLYVGNYFYLPVPFAQRIGFRLVPRRYYIDHRNKTFGLTGQMGSSQVIAQTYLTTTPDLTQVNENTDGIILWPDEHQPLIAYEAARILQGNTDADDVTFRMSGQQQAQYQQLLDGFISWDADLKLESQANQGGYAPEVSQETDGNDTASGIELGLM